MEVVPTTEGSFPNVKTRFLPRPCMHCDHPPCVKVCPVGATFRNREGIVAQIYDRCIGCRYCANNCPYTVKYFNWSAPRFEPPRDQCLNPDVTQRPVGVIEKCTFCHHRLQKARDLARAEKRAMRESEYQPACAESCPTRAIVFGDLDDARSEVSKLSKTPRAFRLLEDLGTEPKVYYLSEEM